MTYWSLYLQLGHGPSHLEVCGRTSLLLFFNPLKLQGHCVRSWAEQRVQ